jgi:hypothetical protein
MRNIDQHNITDAVLSRFEACDNRRLREVPSALVTHLHDFVVLYAAAPLRAGARTVSWV